jgi:hypothetical protein
MTTPIDDIDEEEDVSRRNRSAWGDLYQAWLQQVSGPSDGDTIRLNELSLEARRLVEKTQIAAKAIAQTEMASPHDRMRTDVDVSKGKPAGANAVTRAAALAGIGSNPELPSVFDLSSNKESKAELTRTNVQEMLEGLDEETLEELQKLFAMKAGRETSSSTRPTLAPPSKNQQNYLCLILEMVGSMEELVSACADQLESETNKDLEELNRLQEEKAQAIEEYTKELDNKDSWGTLHMMARYLASASSLAIGAWMLSTGVAGPAAYLLLAAGGLGLATSVATDMGAWKSLSAYLSQSEETQKHLAQSMEFAASLVPLGLGLIGTILAAPVQAPTALTWMSAALSASSKLGNSLAEKRFEFVQAKIEGLSRQMFTVQQQQKSTSNQMKQTLEMAKMITEEAKRIVSSAEISFS